jgi:pimeloyl-ACP methyl ester carboxylesterase
MKKSAGPRSKDRDAGADGEVRVRRAYFECRYGQLNVRTAFPASGGFDERTTLLCLHSETGSSRVFARLLPEIAQDRSVYAPDLPGCGESDPPVRRGSIADYALAMGDFIDTMHFRQLDVLGSGVGALLAAELAVSRPQLVRRLALVAPLGATEQSHAVHPDIPLHELHNGPAAHWVSLAVQDYPAVDRLPLIRQPVLLIRPRDDVSEQGARLRLLLRAPRTMELPHESAEVFAGAMQAVVQQLREFLDPR